MPTFLALRNNNVSPQLYWPDGTSISAAGLGALNRKGLV